jgi:Tn3 transposase DDE domain
MSLAYAICSAFGLRRESATSKIAALIAAIILWNTRYLEQALVELERQGVNVSPAIVTHLAPLGWEHIGLTGDYVWSDGRFIGHGKGCCQIFHGRSACMN